MKNKRAQIIILLTVLALLVAAASVYLFAIRGQGDSSQQPKGAADKTVENPSEQQPASLHAEAQQLRHSGDYVGAEDKLEQIAEYYDKAGEEGSAATMRQQIKDLQQSKSLENSSNPSQPAGSSADADSSLAPTN